jgi:flagellar basal body P-ring protein FlgI
MQSAELPRSSRKTEQGMMPRLDWLISHACFHARRTLDRRAVLLAAAFGLAGCTGPALRSQSPEDLSEAIESSTRLIGDVARPYGNNYIKVESVALVTGLAGTGEDPAPSPQRAMLLHEMQTRGVQDPNTLLASPNTALVLVRGFLPPGIQKGDRFDLEVQTPSRSETTSLRNGWLMECRMTELEVLGNQIHDGHLLAHGEGALLVDPIAAEKDATALKRARVLGGGTANKSRNLGLVISSEDKSIQLSSQIGNAINRRFHTFSHGIKKGVANPKTDEFVELAVHPRYKDNINRYLRVVRAIAVKETVANQGARIGILERQLTDHVSAATAAVRLEAIGHDGVPTLLKGIEESDPEVRFYSAEALAYLDRREAAAPLARAAREEPAFRVYALAALSAMDEVAAYDELRNLLEVPSSETRYGAFRSLWALNPKDPLVKGEMLSDQFSYHVLKTSGPPMIHVTRSFRPEIVLFGENQQFETPLILEAGKSIMINAQEDGETLTIARFEPGKPDQRRTVSNSVDEVIRTIVELGATYPDVVQLLQQAKTSHALASRFEVDAIPDSSAQYARKTGGDEDGAENHHGFEVAAPRPELFSSAPNASKK